jgi:hypothetical protein
MPVVWLKLSREKTMSEQEQTKNWRDMTESERIEIQDEVTRRQMEDQQRQMEEQRKRAVSVVDDRRVWGIADLQRFISRLNSTARKHGCLDRLPTQCFESREAFLDAAVPVLREHNVSEEEIAEIFTLNEQVNATRV